MIFLSLAMWIFVFKVVCLSLVIKSNSLIISKLTFKEVQHLSDLITDRHWKLELEPLKWLTNFNLRLYLYVFLLYS